LGGAAANVRCLNRYSTLRAVPVFLLAARRAACRSTASYPVVHGPVAFVFHGPMVTV